MEKALGSGGQQAEHEPAVTLAATMTKSFLGCVNTGGARDQGKRFPSSTQQSLDHISIVAPKFGAPNRGESWTDWMG